MVIGGHGGDVVGSPTNATNIMVVVSTVIKKAQNKNNCISFKYGWRDTVNVYFIIVSHIIFQEKQNMY